MSYLSFGIYLKFASQLNQNYSYQKKYLFYIAPGGGYLQLRETFIIAKGVISRVQ